MGSYRRLRPDPGHWVNGTTPARNRVQETGGLAGEGKLPHGGATALMTSLRWSMGALAMVVLETGVIIA